MEIIPVIVEKIVEYSVGPIGEQFGYLIFYKRRIAILKEKFLRLREKEEAVKQSVDGAQCNQEVVPSEVKTWLTDVAKKIEEVQKFLDEVDVKANMMCLNGSCPDLKLRYSLGKKAQKNTQAINDLLKEGEKYDQVYNIKIPLRVKSTSSEQFKDFESRRSTIVNVLEALRDEKIDMIALCGMGGIGKTEMAKEIARRVKADSLFNKVAIAVVSQKADLIKVQDEIAEQLGLELHEKTLVGRASQLYSRLMDSKSVMVILDDVWEPLDLAAIGVIDAVKQKSCKILLTSRNEDTCNWMRIQKIFPVGLLSEEEAWNLFIEMAGDCTNTDLILIVKQVANECACLPLAIATVGRALSNKKDKNEWKAALQQLKMSIPQNIYGLHPKVYFSIEFSYNYLGSDEAKSCFLLCCLYPEDYDVPIEHLVRYGVAKRFLKGFDTEEQTRVDVHTIVQNLRRSNLLLDSGKDECIKMHDVVRDVAISIASREENGFMVKLDRGLKDWPSTDRSYDSYTAISLLLGEMKGHPTELKCLKLQLLRLSCLNQSETFPYNLFNGMKELKMLSLQECCFSLTSSPPSIQILQNLRMLNLEDCLLGDVSAIGTLGNLEILGFPNSNVVLPREIGNLSRLKLLDMKGYYSKKQIAAGVFYGLSKLEELYVEGFTNWGCTTMMEGNGEVTNNNASLAELIPYSNQLVVLEINVPNICCLPEELDFCNSDFRFNINGRDDGRYLFENTLGLKMEDASDLGEHRTFRSLLKKAVVLWLDIAKNSKHIWFEKEQKRILPCSLKDLKISRCEDLEYLLEGTSDVTPPNTFHLLESLSLNNLPRLIGICNSTDSVEVERGGSTTPTTVAHKLFSSNTILWVPKLGSLNVEDCRSLEVNIPQGFQGFQNLISINIKKCHTLRNLLPASIAKLLVQLQEVILWECNLMEIIIQREYEAGEERRVITLTKQGEENVSETENQTKMLSLFPHNLIESLENLQKLTAYQCDSLEVIFELEGLNTEESNSFNNLTKLSLRYLSKLLHIWKKGPRDIKGFNYLRWLQVWKSKLLVKLEEIEVHGCNEMEAVLAKESGDEENRDVIVFPLVKTLELMNLQKLECFYTEDNHAFEWPSLHRITIAGCPKLKMFASTSTKTPKLKGVYTI
ncbi:hypothetical protein I3842_16G054300, partial [Carya illinoinensis]